MNNAPIQDIELVEIAEMVYIGFDAAYGSASPSKRLSESVRVLTIFSNYAANKTELSAIYRTLYKNIESLNWFEHTITDDGNIILTENKIPQRFRNIMMAYNL